VDAKPVPSCSGCALQTFLDWNPPSATLTGSSGQLQNYSGDVEVSNITSNGLAEIVIDLSGQAAQNRLQYWFFLCGTGHYEVDRVTGGETPIASGSFNPAKSHMAGYKVQGTKIVATLDGSGISSKTESSAKVTSYVGLWLDCDGTTACSTDYANFRVALLS